MLPSHATAHSYLAASVHLGVLDRALLYAAGLSEVRACQGGLPPSRSFFGRTPEMAEMDRFELLEEART